MTTSAEALVGEVVAERYKVLSHLGSGGFGAVYMAKHTKLNNPVALKVLHQHLIQNDEAVQRFEREAEATSKLKHNAIAGVHDVGVLSDGRPYMVMEYLSGMSLGDIIETEGALPPERVVPLFVECCDALRYAHRKGLLHRDIKPDNIFVIRDIDGVEHAKLLDFGLAKMVFGDETSTATRLTESGIALGTPWYMSPEQCQAKPLDGRSDLYSLAYSMYEALAGRRPFPGRTHYEAMEAHLKHKVPPLNRADTEPIVPQTLEDAVLRCLAKAPNDRFATADEFRDAIAGTVSGSAFAGRGTPLGAPAQLQRETLSPVMKTKTKAAGGARKKAGAPAASSGNRDAKNVIVSIAALVLLIGLMVGGTVWYQSNTVKNAASVVKPVVNAGDSEPGPVAAPIAEPAVVPDTVPSTDDLQKQKEASRLAVEAAQQQELARRTEQLRIQQEQLAEQQRQIQAQNARMQQQQASQHQAAVISAPAQINVEPGAIQFPERPPLSSRPYGITSSSGTGATGSTTPAERPPAPEGYQWGREGIPENWKPGDPLGPNARIPLPDDWTPTKPLPPRPPGSSTGAPMGGGPFGGGNGGPSGPWNSQ